MSDTIVRSDIFMTSGPERAEPVFPGIRRVILGHDPHLMLVKVWFEKGAIGEVHAHPHTQTTYVVEGVFEVEVDGKKKILRQDDCFYVPPNTDHGAVCLEAGILLDVFSPTREDFLPGAEGLS